MKYEMQMYLRGSVFSIFSICVLLCGTGFCAGYGGGAGSPSNPYLISMATHLQDLSANSGDWDKCFKLTADVSAALYTPVTSFTGVFDGNGYSINGFNCTTDADYVGFFRRVQGATACVKNLTLVSPTVNVPARNYIGAITGSVDNGGVISGCSVVGGSVTGSNQTGGIAGSNNSGSMIGCNSSTSVSGYTYVGGLVGRNEQNSNINDCDVTGQATAGGNYCGGLAGLSIGTILRCSASGNALGYLYVGGLVGQNGESSYAGQISRSFATGQASGTTYIGGLVGCNNRGAIEDSYAWGTVTPSSSEGGGLIGRNTLLGTVVRCYSRGFVSRTGTTFGGLIGKNLAPAAITASFWDTSTSGQLTSDGGTGKTTFFMQQVGTFTVAGVGWDFLGEAANGTADIWRMCANGVDHPRQQWEWPRGDVSCQDGVNFVDFAVFAADWGKTGAGFKGDMDGSGVVGLLDLAIFAADWLAGLDVGLPG
jgi:hypothetical protein